MNEINAQDALPCTLAFSDMYVLGRVEVISDVGYKHISKNVPHSHSHTFAYLQK
jgi:hypothetical protein